MKGETKWRAEMQRGESDTYAEEAQWRKRDCIGDIAGGKAIETK